MGSRLAKVRGCAPSCVPLTRLQLDWARARSNSPSVVFGMTSASKPRVARALLILRDVQFWIPIVVLIGGLLVLGWIH